MNKLKTINKIKEQTKKISAMARGAILLINSIERGNEFSFGVEKMAHKK